MYEVTDEEARREALRVTAMSDRLRSGVLFTTDCPTCYLAGPMTGIEDFNYPLFNSVAFILRALGWRVFNPAETDASVQDRVHAAQLRGFSKYKVYMQLDLLHVCLSDVVFVLPGWEESVGSFLETTVALNTRTPVVEWATGKGVQFLDLALGGAVSPQDENQGSDDSRAAGRVASPAAPPPATNSGTCLPSVLHGLFSGLDEVGEHGLPILDCGAKSQFTDPVTGAQKEESEARFDLVTPDGLTALARVYGYGEGKYPSGTAGPNYLRGFPWHLSIAALERHVQKFKAGEDIDPDSGLPHLAHAAWHCFTLITYANRGLGSDDRAKIRR